MHCERIAPRVCSEFGILILQMNLEAFNILELRPMESHILLFLSHPWSKS
jgi:hypothetical protein